MTTPPVQITPAPLPLSIDVTIATMPDGKNMVVLVTTTPAGQNFGFMPPNVAKNLAANLESIATQAETGLLITGQMPPGAGPTSPIRRGN